MTLLSSIKDFSMMPAFEAIPIVEYHASSTCSESIKARLCFVAQLIMSLIALVIFPIIGLIATAINACQGKGKETFEEMTFILKAHLILIIPTSAVGIFAPLKTTDSVASALENCLRNCESSDDSSLSAHDIENLSLEQEQIDSDRQDRQEFIKIDPIY